MAKRQIKEFYAELNNTSLADLTTEETQKLQTFFTDTLETTELPFNGSELDKLNFAGDLVRNPNHVEVSFS